MSDTGQMLACFEAISAAIEASGGSQEDQFDYLRETGFPLLEVCRFILHSAPWEMKRIRFVQVVGYLFPFLSRADFEAIFCDSIDMGINPYSYIFAHRGGGIPIRIPSPFVMRMSSLWSFQRDPHSSSPPKLKLPPFVASLPSGLVFPWGIEISRCHSLNRIGNYLEAGGPIHIHDCPALRKLPSAVIARQGFQVRSVPWLTKIPSDIEVDGDLELANLPSLSRHGFDIRVRGTLKIRNCPEFRRIHPWLEAGRIDLRL